MNRLIRLIVTVLLIAPVTGSAAILVVDGDGQLTGATGLVILGAGVFDVSFQQGTCIALYDSGLPDAGCLQPDDFPFPTQVGAEVALIALADQVVIDGPGYDFGTQRRPSARYFFASGPLRPRGVSSWCWRIST